MSYSNQTPAQALLAMLSRDPALAQATDAQADKAVSDFLVEVAALDKQHNRGQAIRQEQLAEQLFGRSRNFKDERAARPYLRYNLRAAHEELVRMVDELRAQNSGSVTAAALTQFRAIFNDYLFDLREILVPLQKNVSGWTFFNGGKSSSVSSWEVYRLARSLAIQSAWAPTGIFLDHKASQIASIAVLRQAMELRFERLIAVYPFDAKGKPPRLKHGFHQEFIIANPQFFNADGFVIKELRHLYDWCSEIVHQAYQPYAWQIATAMRRAGDLLQSRKTPPNMAWSIYNAIEIPDVPPMQDAFEQHFLSTYGHGSWRMTRTKPEAHVPNWRPEMACTSASLRPVLNRPSLWRRIRAGVKRWGDGF